MRSYAIDSKNNLGQELSLVVAFLPCQMPKVSILKQVLYKEGATENQRSRSLLIEGDAYYNCTIAIVPIT